MIDHDIIGDRSTILDHTHIADLYTGADGNVLTYHAVKAESGVFSDRGTSWNNHLDLRQSYAY